jgi:hypothetical protein
VIENWHLLKQNDVDFDSIFIGTHLKHTTAVKSIALNSVLYKLRANDSVITDSVAEGSILINALLNKAQVTRSYLNDVLVSGSVVDACRLTSCVIEPGCYLVNITLEGAHVKGGTAHINTPPAVYEPTVYGAPYNITVSRPGYANIGCLEKPIEWWLRRKDEFYFRLGVPRDVVKEYRRLLQKIAMEQSNEYTE